MSNYGPNLLELMTAVIGSIAAVAAVAGAVIQYKSAKLDLRNRQRDRLLPESTSRSEPSSEGKPPQ